MDIKLVYVTMLNVSTAQERFPILYELIMVQSVYVQITPNAVTHPLQSKRTQSQ